MSDLANLFEEDLPLVSCIMPTFERRWCVPIAIRHFLTQDFPKKELIIVDDGTDAVEDLVPDDHRVRYFRLPRKTTVGAKRNFACEQAVGPVIAHWDDDDWHARGRLTIQVEALRRSGADLCGLKNLLYYDIRNGRAWRYDYPEDQRVWLSGSSLVYQRSFWLGHRFPECDVGEDGHFVWSADPKKVLALPDSTIHVGLIHDQNVSPKQTNGHWWRPFPVEEIRSVMGEDWNSYPHRSNVAPARGPGPPTIRNLFACLVHENLECVVDLVQNLRHLDPTSTILLYNGSNNPRLLEGAFPWKSEGVEIHPTPRPMHWGRLHDFALDCMRHGLENLGFDTMTIVDSDQLGLRPGYSAFLSEILEGQTKLGMLGNSAEVQTAHTAIPPAKVAQAEVELWRPFLRRFPQGEAKFVHWSFWPTTVFMAEASRALVKLFDEDRELRQILEQTKVWATEEVILPTLVALLGFRIAKNPCSYDFVRYRTPYSVRQLDLAMNRSEVYWVHPIPRRVEDPLRTHIRGRFLDYDRPTHRAVEPSALSPFLLTMPILARMRQVEGWLDDDEADLLIASTAHALRELPETLAVVEVGSYCGRGTVVLASVVQAVRPSARVWSIDPHDGKQGTADRFITVGPSFERLKANLARAGLAGYVEVVQASAPELAWSTSVAMLVIDGLHDYSSVSRDFAQFASWLVEGGHVAFHDYASYFPGVVAFVNELLASGGYRKVWAVKTLIVLRKNAQPEAT